MTIYTVRVLLENVHVMCMRAAATPLRPWLKSSSVPLTGQEIAGINDGNRVKGFATITCLVDYTR